MAMVTEAARDAAHIVYEAKYLSREAVTVASGQTLKAGHVVGKITASGKIAEHNPAASDGTEAVYGVLVGAVDASAADAAGVVTSYHAAVNGSELTWKTGISAENKALGVADLAAKHVVVL